MKFQHISVLLHECMDGLSIKSDGIYVDGTAGGAGHSCEIAGHLQTGRLIAIDKDPDAVAVAEKRLSSYPCAQVVQSDFSELCGVLDQLGIEAVDGILLDLGVSSYQLDNPERGFSYMHDAPLDMRMSQSGLSAYDVINRYEPGDLVRLLREFGEEKFATLIVRKIVDARNAAPIETTHQLVRLIETAIPAKARREGGHPAKRTFQAVRIAVNGELSSLSICLDRTFERLNPGGRFAIITFHSLEDRMVKQKFASYAKGCTCPPDFPICVCGNKPKGKLITRKPIEATEQELAVNSRSKSAKLRVIEKV